MKVIINLAACPLRMADEGCETWTLLGLFSLLHHAGSNSIWETQTGLVMVVGVKDARMQQQEDSTLLQVW